MDLFYAVLEQQVVVQNVAVNYIADQAEVEELEALLSSSAAEERVEQTSLVITCYTGLIGNHLLKIFSGSYRFFILCNRA
jgi:hypothetical protein